MTAAKYDLNIQQGCTFTRNVTFTNKIGTGTDLTDCLLKAQIREKASSSTVLAEFSCVITDAPNGKATMSLSASQTSAIPAATQNGPNKNIAKYAWDFEITYANSTVDRLLEGVVYLSPEVTR